MKPSRRHVLSALAIVALACQGCGLARDRLWVYTAPRGTKARVGAKDKARARPPSVDSKVPAPNPLPASNGIDVPIIEPE